MEVKSKSLREDGGHNGAREFPSSEKPKVLEVAPGSTRKEEIRNKREKNEKLGKSH